MQSFLHIDTNDYVDYDYYSEILFAARRDSETAMPYASLFSFRRTVL